MEMYDNYVSEVLDHYAMCALWTSTDEDDEPLDKNYSYGKFTEDARRRMRCDCFAFLVANKELLNQSELTAEQIGHDFWLTRNGHGTGFWDRGLGDVGDKLARSCKVVAECDVYIGDDGKLHVN
tara:strand:+ start:553 stop:924 length:372 start_codon:yes stop_codon:yes gene_type:complete